MIEKETFSFLSDGTVVTLGVADAKGLERYSYKGVVIGCCANRIANGRYEIDGKITQLECNRNFGL